MDKATKLNLDNALRSAHSLFKKFDKDNNGVLEKNELLHLLQVWKKISALLAHFTH